MSIFYRGQYTFDVDNDAYIDAIVKYNKEVNIQKLLFDNASTKVEKCAVADLKTLVADAKKNGVKSISMEYITADSYALRDIFPTISTEQVNESQVGKDVIERLNSISHAHKYDMGIFFEGSLFDRSLTMQEAVNAIKQAAKELKIAGAANLTSCQTIVFEYKGELFALRYGTKSDLTDLDRISFDIDDGFVNKYPSEKGLSFKVNNALQSYFDKWKEQGYKNAVLPETLSVNASNQLSVGQQGLFAAQTPVRSEVEATYSSPSPQRS